MKRNRSIEFKADPYTVLRIDRKATERTIKQAYNYEALKVHPDRVSSSCKDQAEEQFRLLTAARDFLLDKDKRAAYDRTYPDANLRVFNVNKHVEQKSTAIDKNKLEETMNSNRVFLSKLNKELQSQRKRTIPVTSPYLGVYISPFQANLSTEEYEKQTLAKLDPSKVLV